MKEIILTQGKIALVNDEDFEWLNQWKWYAHKSKRDHTFYAIRNIKHPKTTIKMHRLILGVTNPKIIVDHIDGNGLNNCRENLRECSSSQNCMNRGPNKNKSIPYKGVYFERATGKWFARITVGGKVIRMGTFKNIEDAARQFNCAAIKYHGDFAKLNDVCPPFPNQ